MTACTRRLKRAKPLPFWNSASSEAEGFGMALRKLRDARQLLRELGAPKAADYVARCIKSTDGARNHARRRRSNQ
ncbi:MAG: hypothetical protein KAX77_01240 [Xanthomonadales bacterium]|nr:hypothetical protein [Xanthomonadales bacterium]